MMEMLAVQVEAPGGITSLVVRSVEDLTPRPDEVKIELIASSINPADVKIRTGAVVPLRGAYPFTLGYDLAGTVVETGAEVTDLAPGTQVLAMSAVALTGVGTWSERVCLPRTSVARLPANVDPLPLARLPLAGLTAYQAVQRAKPGPGTAVLVCGAAGSVGRLAVELLLDRGARVHGLVRRPEQVDQLPTHELFTPHVGQPPTRSVDVVIDAAGADFSPALVDGGLYICLVPDRAPARDVLARRSQRRTVLVTEESGADLEELVELLGAAVLTLETTSIFPMKNIHAAHREFEQDGQRNVVLIREDW
ncbi:putative oxidoreductase [Frankia alni ACN14a]|uniref:Oxidoreductase n=1 Tax=Frankia alni (strain DSM 45986 / CECT 9034 / ACN14a) TaxID=326424 RepID=Q0RU84_FRAAA|nr:putative oxidoreductase [Frankia alni ACN14a]